MEGKVAAATQLQSCQGHTEKPQFDVPLINGKITRTIIPWRLTFHNRRRLAHSDRLGFRGKCKAAAMTARVWQRQLHEEKTAAKATSEGAAKYEGKTAEVNRPTSFDTAAIPLTLYRV